jgi:hypothetical protein
MKTTARMFALCFALILLLSACMGQNAIPVYWPVPVFPMMPGQVRAPEAINSCALYYDNTQSMYGFVDAPGSSYLLTVRSVYDEMLTWSNREFYALLPGNQNFLRWQQVKDKGFDFIKDFTKKRFYTFEWANGILQNKGIGPQQLLFQKGDDGKYPVDFNKFNIIFTDMNEQGFMSTDLAHKLNEQLKKQPDFSLAIYAGISDFRGDIYSYDGTTIDGRTESAQSVGTYVNTASGGNAEGKKVPYYCLMIGRTDDVLRFSSSLEPKLSDQMGKTLFRQYILSSGGLRDISFGEHQLGATVGMAEKENAAIAGIQNGFYTVSASNETINLVPKKRRDLFRNQEEEPAGIQSSALYFRYDPTACRGKKFDDASLNLYCPLPFLSDQKEAVKYTNLSAITNPSNSNEVLCGVYQEYVHVMLGQAAHVSKTTAGSTTQQPKTENTSSTLPLTQFDGQWVALDKEEADEMLQVKSIVLQPGTDVRRVDEKLVSQALLGKQYPNQVWLNVDENSTPNGILRLNLVLGNLKALSAKATGGRIAIRVPVIITRSAAANIPNWVNDFNAPSGSSDVFRTENLTGFFDVLVGNGGAATDSVPITKLALELIIYIQLSGNTAEANS